MGTLEIVLLAAGAVIFIASFLVPVKQEKLKEEPQGPEDKDRSVVTRTKNIVRTGDDTPTLFLMLTAVAALSGMLILWLFGRKGKK